MGVWEFLFAIILLSVAVGVGIVGVAIWGIAKGIGALGRRLHGETSERPRVPEGARRPTKEFSSAPSHERHTSAHGRAREEEPVSRPKSYEYLDVDAGSTADSIARVLRPYVDTPVVGPYALNVLDTLAAMEFRRASLFPEIEGRFARGSMSWERFAMTANAALDAALRNCALLGNRIQGFDVLEYQRYEQFYRDGGFAKNPNPGQARLEHWKLLTNTKKEMDDLNATNEGLLLELGKLAAELEKLSSSQTTTEGTRIAEEVSRLVDETKYYR